MRVDIAQDTTQVLQWFTRHRPTNAIIVPDQTVVFEAETARLEVPAGLDEPGERDVASHIATIDLESVNHMLDNLLFGRALLRMRYPAIYGTPRYAS